MTAMLAAEIARSVPAPEHMSDDQLEYLLSSLPPEAPRA